MKRILLTAIITTLLQHTKVYAQWTPQVAPAGSGNLYSVFAINQNAVAASGYQRVIRTINGGINWTSNLTITGINYFSIHTAEPAHWYSLALNSTWFVVLGNPSGTSLLSGKPDNIYGIHFYSARNAIAVGVAGKVVTTSDTGITWQTQSSGVTSTLYSVWSSAQSHACACGTNGTIICSANGGVSWTSAFTPNSLSLNGIVFASSTVGYCVGNTGTFLKTTDAGATWTLVPTGVTNDLKGVYFIDPDTGYIVGTQGLIMKTTDGAASWTTMISGTTNTLNSVHFVTPTAGWVVGNNATILKYNSGTTEIYSTENEKSYSVFPNPATDKLTISSTERGIQKAELYNAVGEVAAACLTVGNNRLPTDLFAACAAELDVSGLPRGLYFLKATVEGKTITRKIILQ